MPVLQMDAADRYCLHLAATHYENFPVVSRLVPRDLRLDLARIYAFCRGADDAGDEAADAAEALRLLDAWEANLDRMYAGRPDHPVFVALARTVERRRIPAEPFRRLIAAFRRDQFQRRYETFDDLLTYCRDSADPVGRLVLHLLDLADEERGRLADRISTGLQLVNFLADVPIDLAKGRIYIPTEDLDRFGVSEDDLEAWRAAGRADEPRWRNLMAFECARTRRVIESGLPLLGLLPARARRFVGLFPAGGLRVLRRIEEVRFDVFAGRPRLRRRDAPALLARAAAWTLRPPGGRAGSSPAAGATGRCEAVLRARAGNFWPALRLLDADRRRSIAALYTFARYLDDIVDGPEGDSPQEARWREIMDLRGELDAAWNGAAGASEEVAAAVAVLKRHGLPRTLLDDLLAGCASDIERVRYQSWEDLRLYCRNVAGTVGVMTARVMGARDDARAEEMGIAFQLTNILRDIEEDAARGRVYIPLEDLAAFAVRPDDLLAGRRPDGLRALLAFEADRARALYDRAAPIADEVAAEARPAMRALIGIYRTLLERIATLGPAALDRRVEVPWHAKARIVVRAYLGG